MREKAADDSMRVVQDPRGWKADPPVYLIEVKKKADVNEPWDYYDVLGQVPPEEAFIALSESECPPVKASN